MFPTSTPRLMVSAPTPQRGQMSPSSTSCTSTRSPSKSRPRTTRSRCASFLFAPATYGRASTERSTRTRLELLDRRDPRRADLGGRTSLRRNGGGQRTGGLLHVGLVVAIRADDDAIVAGLCQHLELVSDVATHGTGVRLDADRLEAHAL